jgi:nicotinamide-nucleotide amidase
VKFHTTVGDYNEDIIEAFGYAQKRADIVIVTGGLGPTKDDLTAGAAARFFRVDLKQNPDALNMIKERFSERKRNLLEINKKPAILPVGSKIIDNKIGTAPGFYYDYMGTVYYFLPGVHKEFKPMMQGFVLSDLNSRFKDRTKTQCVLIKTFGLKESEVALKIRDLNRNGVYLGYRSHFPEIHLRITAEGSSSKETNRKINGFLKNIRSEIGDYIFSESEKTMEEVVGNLLLEKGLSISLAESCTGGLVSHRITNVAGSSEYFNRAVICYSNDSKINDLGVGYSLIEKHGAVSEQVAGAMAKGILDLSGSDIGVGITGIAGPGGGSNEKPVGTVYISLVSKKGDIISEKYSYHGDRQQVKLITSTQCLDMIRKFLLNYV